MTNGRGGRGGGGGVNARGGGSTRGGGASLRAAGSRGGGTVSGAGVEIPNDERGRTEGNLLHHTIRNSSRNGAIRRSMTPMAHDTPADLTRYILNIII